MQFGEGLLEDLILPAIDEEGYGEGGTGGGMFENLVMVRGMKLSHDNHQYHNTCTNL